MSEPAAGGHLAIQYCPYCGEEDLFPRPEPRGAWRCAGCTRSFVVSLVRGSGDPADAEGRR